MVEKPRGEGQEEGHHRSTTVRVGGQMGEGRPAIGTPGGTKTEKDGEGGFGKDGWGAALVLLTKKEGVGSV